MGGIKMKNIFEYRTDRFLADDHELIKNLNKLGADGWELVYLYKGPPCYSHSYNDDFIQTQRYWYDLILKRQINEH